MTAVRSSTLFENATIISYDEKARSLKTLRNASLLVEDGKITRLAEGKLDDIPTGIDTIDATNKIISPGFINTHHHMWQSAFRSIAGDTTLHEYFARYGQTGPSSTNFTPEDVYVGQLACAIEQIDGGTTTVLDHAHGVFSDEHVDASVNASFASGLRIYYAHAIQEIQGTGYSYTNAISKLLALTKDSRFTDQGNPVQLGVAYDGFAFAPSENSMQIMDLVIDHNNSNSGLSSASAAPISVLTSHFVAGPYGANNSPTLLNNLPTSVLSQPKLTTPSKLPVILSHGSFLTPSDANLLRAHPNVTISTTPESETHYGHTSVGADMCQDCASLGVDTHFTFSSYMPFQARIWMQLLRSKYYTQTAAENWEIPIQNPMTCEMVFLLMTQKGGEALGRDDLGVIKVGAEADLVVFDTDSRAGLWGVKDAVAAVILHTGGGGDVEAVMVQGRWLKRDHKIITPLVGTKRVDSQQSAGEVNVEDVKRRFQESAKRIQKIWGNIDRPTFTEGKASWSGATYGTCRTIDVRRR